MILPNPFVLINHLIKNYARTSLAVVSLFATMVSAPGVLLNQSIEYDEAISLLVVSGNPRPDWPDHIQSAGQMASVFSGSAELSEITRIMRSTDVHPPLYFWLLGIWRDLFGNGIEVARTLSMLCAWGASFALGLIVLGAGGTIWWAISASLLFTLSPMGIYLATTARPYALASLLITGATLGAMHLVAARKVLASLNPVTNRALSFSTGLLAGLAVFANYLAILPAGLVGLWLSLRLAMQRRWPSLALAVVGAMLPLVASGYMLSSQLGTRSHALAGFEGWGLLFKTASMAANMFAPSNWSLSLMKENGSTIALTLTGIVFVLGILMALRDLVTEPRRRDFWSLCALLSFGSILGLVAIGALLDKSLTIPRYIYAAIPFLACVAAFPAMPGKIRLIAASRHLLVAVLIGLQAVWVWDAQRGAKDAENWRHLASAAAELDRENTVVVIDAGYGRAVPASLIYELPPDMSVRVVTKHSRQDRVFTDIANHRYVLLVPSWQKEGKDRLRSLIQTMGRSGKYSLWPRLGRNVILEKKT